jgi:hypothetical protein
MKKEIKIVVPTDWSAITLKTYLALQRDLKVYGEDENGYVACLMHHLCGFNAGYINQLDTETFVNIKNDLTSFMTDTKLPLQKFITIDGVKYGLEPNIGKMAYGAYLDITQYDTFTIDENWSKIMSILYRPVTKERAGLYEIEDYKGNIDGDKFLSVTMDVHHGALFFFVRLLMGLPSVILKSLMATENLPHNIKSILEKSGEITPQLSSLQGEILDGWKM